MQKQVEDIIKEIGANNRINPLIVHKIYMSQYKFVSQVIRSSDRSRYSTFKSVLLPCFGKFYPKTEGKVHPKPNKEENDDNR